MEYLNAPKANNLGIDDGSVPYADIGNIFNYCTNLKTVKFTTKSNIKFVRSLGDFNSEQCVLYLNSSKNDNSIGNNYLGQTWKEIIFVD